MIITLAGILVYVEGIRTSFYFMNGSKIEKMCAVEDCQVCGLKPKRASVSNNFFEVIRIEKQTIKSDLFICTGTFSFDND